MELGKYKVIYRLKQEADHQSFFCRQGEAFFLLVEPRRRDRENTTPDLNESSVTPVDGAAVQISAYEKNTTPDLDESSVTLVGNCVAYMRAHPFSDFVEDFTIDGRYFLVFRTAGTPIAGKTMTQQERAELANSLVRAIAEKNPPLPLLINVLSQETLALDGQGRVHFLYTPPRLLQPVSRPEVCARLADCIGELWQDPQAEESQRWLDTLRQDGFLHFADAYLQMPPPEAATVPSAGDKARAWLERLLKLTAALLLAAGVAFGVWQMFFAPTEPPPRGTIQAIGEVQITTGGEDSGDT